MRRGEGFSMLVLILDPPQTEGQVVVGPECFLMDREFLTCARQMLEYRWWDLWWDLEDADSIELWGAGRKLSVVPGDGR